MIGRTPLLKLGRLAPNQQLFAKCEFMNPLSLKDRPILQVIEDAKVEGRLSPDSTLIECTSGNTGMAVAYIGPDGRQMETGLKEAHTELLKRNGYRVVYLGNGDSDIYPARLADHVFATGELLGRCREENLECIPFDDLNDVVRGLEALSPG